MLNFRSFYCKQPNEKKNKNYKDSEIYWYKVIPETAVIPEIYQQLPLSINLWGNLLTEDQLDFEKQ